MALQWHINSSTYLAVALQWHNDYAMALRYIQYYTYRISALLYTVISAPICSMLCSLIFCYVLFAALRSLLRCSAIRHPLCSAQLSTLLCTSLMLFDPRSALFFALFYEIAILCFANALLDCYYVITIILLNHQIHQFHVLG